MDEQRRSGDEVTINFLLSVSTKPSLVKFEVGGTATVSGEPAAIKEALEVDPESNVPKILHNIYQNAFTSIFVISTLIRSPYPSPTLLHSPVQTRELQAEASQNEAVTRPEDQVAVESSPQGAVQKPS